METNGVVVALLVIAIVFSVVSIVFLMDIGNLNASIPKAPSQITTQAVQGHQSGNVALNVVGGAP
jgi:cell division protein FtsL